MSSERELDEGIKSIKSAWRREHTARANLEKMLQQAETENAKLRVLVDELWALADGYAPDDSELDTARDLMRELGIEADNGTE